MAHIEIRNSPASGWQESDYPPAIAICASSYEISEAVIKYGTSIISGNKAMGEQVKYFSDKHEKHAGISDKACCLRHLNLFR
jgi:hypothetical protein